MQVQPTVYEINTDVYLYELTQKYGYSVSFHNIPDQEWDDIAATGASMVWWMGVWTRSDISRQKNQGSQWLKDALPDVTDKDVRGSAYSIADYVVDPFFGGDEGLAVAREKLRQRGIKMMLDFVPNHVAIDHPWAKAHPEYFIQGDEGQDESEPGAFIRVGSTVLALGKDPHYEPWSDVLQFNAFSRVARLAVAGLVGKIASQCDALRCDMAMLMMNDVFAHTWGYRAGAVPEQEYWPLIIGAVKAKHPDFIFLAEVYWGKEKDLIAQGFDFCYDKELYDHLISGSVHGLKHHLQATENWQHQLMRFSENHDEERIARLPLAHHAAASVIALTLPGMRLFHHGQQDGRIHRVPVQLRRRPEEPLNDAVQKMYTELLEWVHNRGIGRGMWYRETVRNGFFGYGAHHVLAWSWQNDAGKSTVLVNFSAHSARVYIGDARSQHLRPWQYVLLPEIEKDPLT